MRLPRAPQRRAWRWTKTAPAAAAAMLGARRARAQDGHRGAWRHLYRNPAHL